MEATAWAGPEQRKLRFELLADQDATLWNSFVDRHPRASIYHRYEWRRLVSELFGHETHYWCARSRFGTVEGVLPLVRLRSRLFGDYQVSMPYFNYGGVLGRDEEAEQALLTHAGYQAQQLGLDHLELRDIVPREDGWPVRSEKVAMHLALPAEVGDLWESIGGKLRAQIRRPLREGVTISTGGHELLGDFYKVFARNMRDLGTPVYPQALFERIMETFPNQAFVVTVNLDQRPVAAAFLLGWRDTLEIPWASSVREFNRLGVNMLLYWEVLRMAIDRGYRCFDFGRCTEGSGTYRFKRQWGARPVPLYWYYWLPEGAELPFLSPANPKYRLAIGAWQKLPLAVANWLGPRLVKNLP